MHRSRPHSARSSLAAVSGVDVVVVDHLNTHKLLDTQTMRTANTHSNRKSATAAATDRPTNRTTDTTDRPNWLLGGVVVDIVVVLVRTGIIEQHSLACCAYAYAQPTESHRAFVRFAVKTYTHSVLEAAPDPFMMCTRACTPTGSLRLCVFACGAQAFVHTRDGITNLYYFHRTHSESRERACE